MSVLTGASERSEQEVLAFLDRAEDLGLVQQGFHLNDESMRFLGKRVLEICYRQIGEKRRQELHERAGAYQEALNEDGLWPAASLLAYHFRRSGNQTKTRQYDRMQATYRDTVFNPTEAAGYSADVDQDQEVEPRLTPQSLPLIPGLLRTLVGAVRAIQLYPAESRAALDARKHAQNAIETILSDNRRLHLVRIDQALLANGQRLDVSEYADLARSFLGALQHAELKGVAFETGLTETELGAFIEGLSQARPETIDHGFWRRFSEERSLTHLHLEQMRYVAVRRRVATGPGTAADLAARGLEETELAHLPTVLRAFAGATVNLKLYPVGSPQVVASLEELRETLQPIFRGHAACSLAIVNHALLANGVRVATEHYQTVADRFTSILEPVGLRSITFGAAVTTDELVCLVEALRNPPVDIDANYWQQLATQQGFSGLALNEQHYKPGVIETIESLVGEAEEHGDGIGQESLEQRLESLAGRPKEALRAALPEFGKELLVRGEVDMARRMLGVVFADFSELDVAARMHTVRACATLFESLILALRHRFLQVFVDVLVANVTNVTNEDDERVLGELTRLLHAMSASAVQFADYDLASRILLALSERRRTLELTPGNGARTLERAVSRDMAPAIAKVLEEDLVSPEVDRHGPAAQALGSLGAPAIPLLVGVITRERRFRTRRLAAALLADLGPRAADALKQALVTEVETDQRFRIIEVLDVVTSRVKDQLAYCLADSSPKIREAAYQLAERIGDPGLVDVVAPHAQQPDLELAQAAIGCLSRLDSEAAVHALVTTLNGAKHNDHAVACAQALGRLGGQAAIDALAALLLKKRWFGGWKWDDRVRATAVAALEHMGSPEAETALSRAGVTRQRETSEETETAPLSRSAAA
ncbi:MAG: HEAT repeat domain-containing protein [Acidobacteria bacterium]|nr:HEAT repeat domain-containing protein [Acidobacteriota bacterium]